MTTAPTVLLSVDTATANLDTAKRHVIALEDRVSRGDTTVTGADLAAARADVDLAQLRLTSANKAVQDGQDAARLADCQALHVEIAAIHGAAPELASLLRAADTHLRAFIDAARLHNAFVGNALQRMHSLDVPEHRHGTVPSPDHAGLGFTGTGEILAGHVQLEQVDAERWIALVARAALTEGTSNPPRLRHISDPPGGYAVTDPAAALVAQAAGRRAT